VQQSAADAFGSIPGSRRAVQVFENQPVRFSPIHKLNFCGITVESYIPVRRCENSPNQYRA